MFESVKALDKDGCRVKILRLSLHSILLLMMNGESTTDGLFGIAITLQRVNIAMNDTL